MHDVAKLAHVSRPNVLLKPLDGPRREAAPGALLALGHQVEEVLREDCHVVAPLPQGNDMKGQDVEPVIQVLTQDLLLDSFDEIAIRARDDPDVASDLGTLTRCAN